MDPKTFIPPITQNGDSIRKDNSYIREILNDPSNAGTKNPAINITAPTTENARNVFWNLFL